MEENVKAFLEKNNIKYTLHEHKPVFTCEQAKQECGHIPGLDCKNLFLKDKKTTQFYLFVMPAEKRANLKQIKQIVQAKHLTFGKPEELLEKTNLTPGSVSPLGLLNNKENDIKLYIDKQVWDSEIVTFHPNSNDATLEITHENFDKIIQNLENQCEIIELEE